MSDPAPPALSASFNAIDAIPPGSWAVGVSGGPDSVALLALLARLRPRADLGLHVVHLDHQLRGSESDDDARFVADLARQWNLTCTVARREQIEPLLSDLPANPSARYRRLRLALFGDVVRANGLSGVILAHHADDQAETILQRLLRGSGASGLAGMSRRALIGDLVLLRPLLGVRRDELRALLREIGQPWRTDSTNVTPAYLRNRLRSLLDRLPALHDALVDLGEHCGRLRDWVRAQAPTLEDRFLAARLADLPIVLGRESARRWLAARGVPPGELLPQVIDRLIEMARDAASASRQDFPGPTHVRRRAGAIFVE